MKVAVFDSDSYVREYFDQANSRFRHELTYFDERMNQRTARLAKDGVGFIALRSAGYNNVDLQEAERLGFRVARVPAYSPHAIAEHAVGLLLCLNRNIHKAFFRVRNLNFATTGLLVFDLFGKTIGVVGTGRIGAVFSEVMKGFGCKVIACDPKPDQALVQHGILHYVDLADELGPQRKAA